MKEGKKDKRREGRKEGKKERRKESKKGNKRGKEGRKEERKKGKKTFIFLSLGLVAEPARPAEARAGCLFGPAGLGGRILIKKLF